MYPNMRHAFQKRVSMVFSHTLPPTRARNGTAERYGTLPSQKHQYLNRGLSRSQVKEARGTYGAKAECHPGTSRWRKRAPSIDCGGREDYRLPVSYNI